VVMATHSAECAAMAGEVVYLVDGLSVRDVCGRRRTDIGLAAVERLDEIVHCLHNSVAGEGLRAEGQLEAGGGVAAKEGQYVSPNWNDPFRSDLTVSLLHQRPPAHRD